MRGKKKRRKADDRDLGDLTGVGRETLKDFAELGIATVRDLARQDPAELYDRLCRRKRTALDICVRDMFEAAVAQALDPDLPAERRNWWWWSRRRKAGRG